MGTMLLSYRRSHGRYATEYIAALIDAKNSELWKYTEYPDLHIQLCNLSDGVPRTDTTNDLTI
jgi:hypothetical protein